MLLKDVNVNLKDVLEEIQNSDKLDSERELSPLKPAEESICINTDSLTIDVVVTDILQIIKLTTTFLSSIRIFFFNSLYVIIKFI